MKIHLISGFLGSGKTTALLNASKILTNKGVSCSVITNDQGSYLVDSRFINQSNIPLTEVTGGCFCCNYNQLDSKISKLQHNFNPSVVFAESVGSCTDVISTVLKPMIKYRKKDIEQVTFSSFVDSQLLLMYLKNEVLPFKAETVYIWEKQLEEAEILIVNKIDLLKSNELEELKLLVNLNYQSKLVIFQNSHDIKSITNWLNVIDSNIINLNHKSIEVDYDKYAVGEANLAWLDEEINIVTTNSSALEVAFDFIGSFTASIAQKSLTIGHLKFYLTSDNESLKISFTSLSNKRIINTFNNTKSNKVNLLVNARIQTDPNELRKIITDILNVIKSHNQVSISEQNVSFFKTGYPKPTHRIL